MPPSAVVDASVLVSAFLFTRSVPGRVLTCAKDGRFSLKLSPLLIEETRRSLLAPRLVAIHRQAPDAVETWCADLVLDDTVFTGALPDIGTVCRDPDDDHVIAAAVAVGAAVIVTGDKDLLSLGQFRSIRILTARAFLIEITP